MFLIGAYVHIPDLAHPHASSVVLRALLLQKQELDTLKHCHTTQGPQVHLNWLLIQKVLSNHPRELHPPRFYITALSPVKPTESKETKRCIHVECPPAPPSVIRIGGRIFWSLPSCSGRPTRTLLRMGVKRALSLSYDLKSGKES